MAEWVLCVQGRRPTRISSKGFSACLLLAIGHRPLSFPILIPRRILFLSDQILNVCHQAFIVSRAGGRKGTQCQTWEGNCALKQTARVETKPPSQEHRTGWGIAQSHSQWRTEGDKVLEGIRCGKTWGGLGDGSCGKEDGGKERTS